MACGRAMARWRLRMCAHSFIIAYTRTRARTAPQVVMLAQEEARRCAARPLCSDLSPHSQPVVLHIHAQLTWSQRLALILLPAAVCLLPPPCLITCTSTLTRHPSISLPLPLSVVSPPRLGHNFVGTEQILLGLIGESTGIAAKVLKSMGVNLKDARVEVEKIIGRGSGFVAVEIPFTPRAKRVLELSLEEARQLGAWHSVCVCV